MLGSLLGIMLLVRKDNGEADHYCGSLSADALTDNMGNRSVLARMLTTKWSFPSVPGVAGQLERNQILFEMCWGPREQNAEADGTTKGDYAWLSPEKRVATAMEALPFEVLPAFLSHGAAFYEGKEVVSVVEE